MLGFLFGEALYIVQVSLLLGPERLTSPKATVFQE